MKPGVGLFGKIKWTDIGKKLIENRVFRFLSPSWWLNDKMEPVEMTSVALTNKPAIDGNKPIVNSAPVEKEISTEETKSEGILSMTKEELAAMVAEMIDAKIAEAEKAEVVEEVKEEVKEEVVDTAALKTRRKSQTKSLRKSKRLRLKKSSRRPKKSRKKRRRKTRKMAKKKSSSLRPSTLLLRLKE